MGATCCEKGYNKNDFQEQFINRTSNIPKPLEITNSSTPTPESIFLEKSESVISASKIVNV